MATRRKADRKLDDNEPRRFALAPEDPLEHTAAARTALFATAGLALVTLLVRGWHDEYSFSLVLGLACLSFSFCAVVRRVLDHRSSELRDPVFVLASVPVVSMIYIVSRLYVSDTGIDVMFAPIVVFYGGLLGFGTSSVEYLIDYTVLSLLSVVFSAVTGLSSVNSIGPWALVAGGLGVLLKMRGPSFVTDIGLLGPFAFGTFEYAIPVDGAKVPLVPIGIAIGVLAATSVTFRLVRWPQRVKVAIAVAGAMGVIAVFPPW